MAMVFQRPPLAVADWVRMFVAACALLILRGSADNDTATVDDACTMSTLRNSVLAAYKRRSPPVWRPVVGIFVDILGPRGGIALQGDTLKVSALLRLHWRDLRLNFSADCLGEDWPWNSQDDFLSFDPNEVWTPNIQPPNGERSGQCAQSAVRVYDRMHHAQEGGIVSDFNILYSRVCDFTVSCSTSSEDFPFDTQQCELKLTSWTDVGIVELQPVTVRESDSVDSLSAGVGQTSAFKAGEYNLLFSRTPSVTTGHQASISRTRVPMVVFHLGLARSRSSCLLYVVMPLVVLNVISWLALCLPLTRRQSIVSSDRSVISALVQLASVAVALNGAGRQPHIGDISWLDYTMLMTVILSTLPLVETLLLQGLFSASNEASLQCRSDGKADNQTPPCIPLLYRGDSWIDRFDRIFRVFVLLLICGVHAYLACWANDLVDKGEANLAMHHLDGIGNFHDDFLSRKHLISAAIFALILFLGSIFLLFESGRRGVARSLGVSFKMIETRGLQLKQQDSFFHGPSGIPHLVARDPELPSSPSDKQASSVGALGADAQQASILRDKNFELVSPQVVVHDMPEETMSKIGTVAESEATAEMASRPNSAKPKRKSVTRRPYSSKARLLGSGSFDDPPSVTNQVWRREQKKSETSAESLE
eukprot:TRINITY_DN6088_c0_g1_i2.p1 TRINITY_DN6088_c0_g1~~TRINITY_DN6088_c0_g1_i2.p1  ORF type:complete len:649 (-),score=79.21 TRINITY_DN6088_c0_g1_i2:109-2055(-)